MKNFWKNNGLSLTMFGLFCLFLTGQSVAGWKETNQERIEAGRAAWHWSQYITSGSFWGAVFENWESEFLQMAFYVLLTVWLFQRGSSESKKPNGDNTVDEDPQQPQSPTNKHPDHAGPRDDAPWPVRRGGWALVLYRNSLFVTLFAIFAFSFIGHVWAGSIAYSHEQQLQGKDAVSIGEYLVSARFWFESLQNWQSEFLAVGALIVLSIWLRQQGSPESKPVARPHRETGSD